VPESAATNNARPERHLIASKIPPHHAPPAARGHTPECFARLLAQAALEIGELVVDLAVAGCVGLGAALALAFELGGEVARRARGRGCGASDRSVGGVAEIEGLAACGARERALGRVATSMNQAPAEVVISTS
jgi:hypothetical protein